MVLVSLQDFSESKLSHHFHKKLSTISRNHGVIIVPFVSLFSEHKTICNYDNYGYFIIKYYAMKVTGILFSIFVSDQY